MDRLRLSVWGSVLIAIAIAGGVSASAQSTNPTSDGWVVLPVSEYAALKRAAAPTEPEPEPPPVEATLSRIDYNLKIDGDLATGEARLTVDVIKNGWVRVPLPDGLMVRDAQLDGHPVNLATNEGDKGSSRVDLLLSKTGRSVLTLKIVAPVKTVAGTDVLQLPVSNSALSPVLDAIPHVPDHESAVEERLVLAVQEFRQFGERAQTVGQRPGPAARRQHVPVR